MKRAMCQMCGDGSWDYACLDRGELVPGWEFKIAVRRGVVGRVRRILEVRGWWGKWSGGGRSVGLQ
jgi:hypothetical protein